MMLPLVGASYIDAFRRARLAKDRSPPTVADPGYRPGSRLWGHILAALAEMERDLIKERVKAGFTAARARGRKGGRQPKLTDKEVAQARKMLEDKSTTITAVAAKMGVNRATIYRSLGLGAFGTTGGDD
jgi:DNA invertase Pin-like site-specific DNA recombinase